MTNRTYTNTKHTHVDLVLFASTVRILLLLASSDRSVFALHFGFSAVWMWCVFIAV
jgi:hypothetical protein